MLKRCAFFVTLALMVGIALGSIPNAHSQIESGPGVSSVNGCTGICTVQPGNFIGTFTIATLPACNGTTTPYGSIAYVTDLGGGANNAKCIANAWQHFSLGVPVTNSQASGTITITPLASAPIQVLTSSSILSTLTVNIATTNLYPGYILYVARTNSLSGGAINLTISGLGISIPGILTSGSCNSLLTACRNAFVYDGTTLVQIQ